jgi:hypothetical protein
MKTKSTQQEILLMTNTTFSQQQWAEKDPSVNNRLSVTEQLEDACWNGLLYEMFPGIVEKSAAGKQLYLWQIRHDETCLQIELCEQPQVIDLGYSIDPHSFLLTTCYN